MVRSQVLQFLSITMSDNDHEHHEKLRDRIFVSNIPSYMKEMEVRTYFEDFGTFSTKY